MMMMATPLEHSPDGDSQTRFEHHLGFSSPEAQAFLRTMQSNLHALEAMSQNLLGHLHEAHSAVVVDEATWASLQQEFLARGQLLTQTYQVLEEGKAKFGPIPEEALAPLRQHMQRISVLHASLQSPLLQLKRQVEVSLNQLGHQKQALHGYGKGQGAYHDDPTHVSHTLGEG
jgi:hypothetical protein